MSWSLALGCILVLLLVTIFAAFIITGRVNRNEIDAKLKFPPVTIGLRSNPTKLNLKVELLDSTPGHDWRVRIFVKGDPAAVADVLGRVGATGIVEKGRTQLPASPYRTNDYRSIEQVTIEPLPQARSNDDWSIEQVTVEPLPPDRSNDDWSIVPAPVERRQIPVVEKSGPKRISVITLGLIVVGALVTVGVLVGVLVLDGQRIPQLPDPAPTAPEIQVAVADGSDPKATGCGADAVTTDHVDVYFPAQYRVGTLELRSSPHCGTTWGRFLRAQGLPAQPVLHMKLTARRDADAKASHFGIDLAGENVYGNQLLSRFQCVYVETQISQGQQVSPTFRTKCVD